MPEPIVRFDKVVFAYSGTEVLHDVSFTLNKGEIVGLLGPNGAGNEDGTATEITIRRKQRFCRRAL